MDLFEPRVSNSIKIASFRFTTEDQETAFLKKKKKIFLRLPENIA